MRILGCLLYGFLFVSCVLTTELPYVGDTPEEINLWVHSNMEYIADESDDWQTPAETLARGAGDCEDFAFLTAALIDNNIGIHASVVLVYPDIYTCHAVVKCLDRYYDGGREIEKPTGFLLIL